MSHAASEHDVQVSVANIHALAHHLLNLGEYDQLYVGMSPHSRGWRVRVRYESFLMDHEAPTLGDVLELTLRDLMSRVVRRLEESERLMAALGELRTKAT